MRSSAKILLIARDVRLIRATRLEVLSQSSFQMRIAVNCAEGNRVLAEDPPRLVLAHLDSGITDQDVAHLLGKATLSVPAVPILALSNSYQDGRARTLFQLGITDYLGLTEHFFRLVELMLRLVPEGKPLTRRVLPVNRSGFRSAQVEVTPLRDGETRCQPLYHGIKRFSILGEG